MVPSSACFHVSCHSDAVNYTIMSISYCIGFEWPSDNQTKKFYFYFYFFFQLPFSTSLSLHARPPQSPIMHPIMSHTSLFFKQLHHPLLYTPANHSPSTRIHFLILLSKLFPLQGITTHHKDHFGFYLQMGKRLKTTGYASFLFLTCSDSPLQENHIFISKIYYQNHHHLLKY